MSKNVITIKVEAPATRNPVVVAMNRRHGGKGGFMKNRADKRASQKARKAEANAW